jgi:hypothetical protein
MKYIRVHRIIMIFFKFDKLTSIIKYSFYEKFFFLNFICDLQFFKVNKQEIDKETKIEIPYRKTKENPK